MARVYSNAGAWGNAVNWFDYGRRRLVGWTHPRPEAGDLFISAMKSGRRAVFRMRDVEWCRDPHDMWFATADDVGYEDEPDGQAALRDAKAAAGKGA